MKRLLAAVIVVGGFLLGAADPARAFTIGPTGCGGCGAHDTTFNITFAVVDNTAHIYDVTIQAVYGSSVDFAHITAVGIKVDSANIENFVSVSGPDGQSWTKVLGSLNNSAGNGCDATGGEAFACSDATPGSSLPGPDTWVLRLDFDTALNLATMTGSFKARFTDANNAFVGPLLSTGWSATSTTTTTTTTTTVSPTTTGQTPVPEPASLLLLGSGLVAAHRKLRRRATKDIA